MGRGGGILDLLSGGSTLGVTLLAEATERIKPNWDLARLRTIPAKDSQDGRTEMFLRTREEWSKNGGSDEEGGEVETAGQAEAASRLTSR